MKRKRRMGRPPIPKAQRKSVRLSFRVTASLHKAVVEAAKREGKSVGRFITDTLVNAVKGGK
jgi:predicted HicB family RNase H-like nuclease